MEAPNPKKINITLDEVCCLLENHLGCTLRSNGGSHVVANTPNGQILTIVRPHGNEKFIHPNTIRDLIKTYAPPTDNNDTQAYINMVMSEIDAAHGNLKDTDGSAAALQKCANISSGC